jgi:hypothetical protein
VGYAYHVVKMMYDGESGGEKAAEEFISACCECFKDDILPRLSYYKLVGILGVSIDVSS